MKTKLLGILFGVIIIVGATPEASGESGSTRKVGTLLVREADSVKIAQRFIAGVVAKLTNKSAKRMAEGNLASQLTTNLSRPFYGLIDKSRLEPSTEVLGYSHIVHFADEPNAIFAGEVAPQNPSPTTAASAQADQQKATDRNARRAEMKKGAAERQAKNAQRMAEKRAEAAKRAEESKARNAEQAQKRQAASVKRSAEQREKFAKLKAERQANTAKRAAEAEARATKRNEAREAAQAKRAAAAEKRKIPADGTFRFLSSKINAHSTAVVKGSPYSALATTEFVQKFVDGNQIVRRNEAAYYRDSEGRTRVEQKLNTIGKWNASGEAPRIISIGDPVSGAYYNLDPRTRTAVKNVGLGRRLQQQLLRKIQEAGKETTSKPERSNAVSKDGRRKTEELGKQRIEGVEAEGKRVTTTIPAGEIGNTLPIEITDESWFSPELQAVVMTKHHDPRSGDSIYRLTNISRREPDQSLFQVPPDYTIVDQSERKTEPLKTQTEKESKSQLFD